MACKSARPSFETDSSGHESEKEEAVPDSGTDVESSDLDTDFSADERVGKEAAATPKTVGKTSKPRLKLKIKLPPQPKAAAATAAATTKSTKRKRSTTSSKGAENADEESRPLSKKMRESLALNQRAHSSSHSGSDRDNEDDEFGDGEAREGGEGAGGGDNDRLYCVCQCPHDEISRMIGCDGPDCAVEWFHFECIGIVVPPEGKWYCPDCTIRYGLT